MSKKKKKQIGDPRKRAEVRLDDWMRNYYDAECEDDPFWHGAPHFEVPKLSRNQDEFVAQLEVLSQVAERVYGKPPEGMSRRWAVIIDHPFKGDASIVRFKLDVALPEGIKREGWTRVSPQVSQAPAGTIRQEYDSHRAKLADPNS